MARFWAEDRRSALLLAFRLGAWLFGRVTRGRQALEERPSSICQDDMPLFPAAFAEPDETIDHRILPYRKAGT